MVNLFRSDWLRCVQPIFDIMYISYLASYLWIVTAGETVAVTVDRTRCLVGLLLRGADGDGKVLSEDKHFVSFSKGWFILTSPPHSLNYWKCFFSRTQECARMGFWIRAATFHPKTWHNRNFLLQGPSWWKRIHPEGLKICCMPGICGEERHSDGSIDRMEQPLCSGDNFDSHTEKRIVINTHCNNTSSVHCSALCGSVCCGSQIHPAGFPSLLSFP